MAKLPILTANELILALEGAGFQIIRQNGRVVTVPVHPGRDIGRGLLRKILRDAELTREAFITLLK